MSDKEVSIGGESFGWWGKFRLVGKVSVGGEGSGWSGKFQLVGKVSVGGDTNR